MQDITEKIRGFFESIGEMTIVKAIASFLLEYSLYIMLLVIALSAYAIVYHFANRNRKRYELVVDDLEAKKMQIINMPVPFEISKLSYTVNNHRVELKMREWKQKWRDIELDVYNVISEKILELDGMVEIRSFKNIDTHIDEISTLIESNQVKAQNILEDILAISKNENKSRLKVTAAKQKFREIKENYKSNEIYFESVNERIKLLFDQINDRIIEVEDLIQKNDYSVVEMLMTSLLSDIDHAEEVVNRFPEVIEMAKNTVQNKLIEVLNQHRRVESIGLHLTFLDFRRNYDVAINKLDEIFTRVRAIELDGVEDELNGIIRYCDSIVDRLHLEEKTFAFYNDSIIIISDKIAIINETISEIDVDLVQIKKKYQFKTKVLKEIKVALEQTSNYYDIMLDKVNGGDLSYSEAEDIITEVITKLQKIERRLKKLTLKVSDLREDETRAFEQLDQMQGLISNARNLIKISKLSKLPSEYMIYLRDAVESVNNVVLQINSTPLDIETLNTRVSTARDLSLKYYNFTRAYVKTSFIAEKSILYGNRYRSSHSFVNEGLIKSTKLFNSGDFKESITSSMEVLERIEPGIYEKLNDYFSSNMRESNL